MGKLLSQCSRAKKQHGRAQTLAHSQTFHLVLEHRGVVRAGRAGSKKCSIGDSRRFSTLAGGGNSGRTNAALGRGGGGGFRRTGRPLKSRQGGPGAALAGKSEGWRFVQTKNFMHLHSGGAAEAGKIVDGGLVPVLNRFTHRQRRRGNQRRLEKAAPLPLNSACTKKPRLGRCRLRGPARSRRFSTDKLEKADRQIWVGGITFFLSSGGGGPGRGSGAGFSGGGRQPFFKSEFAFFRVSSIIEPGSFEKIWF